jgi:hypothetical protein
MLEFVLVAEGKTDELVVPCLVNRVLCEEGPHWIRDNFEDDPERLWKWAAIEAKTTFRYTKWTTIKQLGDEYKNRLRIFHRPREGNRTAEARKAIALFRLLRETKPANALILARDLDTRPDEKRKAEEHRRSMEVARAEAKSRFSVAVPIILATPKRVLEVWMLHGFKGENEKEDRQLESLRKAFGFDVCERGERLHGDDAKDAIRKLITADSRISSVERREKCWTETTIETLRERGAESHLTDFLDEVRDQLLPLLTGDTSGQQ